MKKTYTKKQISEAIAYWEKVLESLSEEKSDNERQIDKFIEEACHLTEGTICESNGMSTLEVLNNLRSIVKDPKDVEDFINKHATEILDANKKLKPQDKGIFQKAISFIKIALKKGFDFIKKHWGKIMMLVLLIALFIWFGSTPAGHGLGLKLFGQGNAWNGISDKVVNVAKDGIQAITNIFSSSPSVYDSVIDIIGFTPSSWQEVPEEMLNWAGQESGKGTAAIQIAPGVFQGSLADGNFAYSFEELGLNKWFIPVK